jgi:CCR4-NOT transcription complex subunit 9
MVAELVKNPSHRLLKHIIRCYLRLADNPKARDALRQPHILPSSLQDNTFTETLKSDIGATNWLVRLLRNVFPDAPTMAGTV